MALNETRCGITVPLGVNQPRETARNKQDVKLSLKTPREKHQHLQDSQPLSPSLVQAPNARSQFEPKINMVMELNVDVTKPARQAKSTKVAVQKISQHPQQRCERCHPRHFPNFPQHPMQKTTEDTIRNPRIEPILFLTQSHCRPSTTNNRQDTQSSMPNGSRNAFLPWDS